MFLSKSFIQRGKWEGLILNQKRKGLEDNYVERLKVLNEQ